MKTKIEKEYTYNGFGFPIHLNDVLMIEIGGQWIPKIDIEKLSKKVIREFTKRTTSFTGDEIYFIRSFFKLSKVDFGKKLDLSHAAISNWEKKREEKIPFHKGNFDSLIKLLQSTQPKTKQVQKPKTLTTKRLTLPEKIVELLKGKPNPALALARARELLKNKQAQKPQKTTTRRTTRKVAHSRPHQR